MSTEEPGDVANVEVNPAMQAIAIVAAIGATLAARRMLGVAYEKVTGQKPPLSRDLETGFTRAVVWTAITAASAAVIEVAVYRIIAARSAHEVVD